METAPDPAEFLKVVTFVLATCATKLRHGKLKPSDLLDDVVYVDCTTL